MKSTLRIIKRVKELVKQKEKLESDRDKLRVKVFIIEDAMKEIDKLITEELEDGKYVE